MRKIFKVSLALIRDNKLLMLKERGIASLKNPGGKPEEGETEIDALRREIREEIGVGLKNIRHFGRFTNRAIDKDSIITISVYFADVIGEPQPLEYVERLVWISAENKHELNPVAKDVVSALIDKGYLK